MQPGFGGPEPQPSAGASLSHEPGECTPRFGASQIQQLGQESNLRETTLTEWRNYQQLPPSYVTNFVQPSCLAGTRTPNLLVNSEPLYH